VVVHGKSGERLWSSDPFVELADLAMLDLDGNGKLDVFGQAITGRLIGFSGQGHPAPFAIEELVLGALPVVFTDAGAFRGHARVLHSAGRQLLPRVARRGDALTFFAIRMTNTLTASRLPYPATRAHWGPNWDYAASLSRAVPRSAPPFRQRVPRLLFPWPR